MDFDTMLSYLPAPLEALTTCLQDGTTARPSAIHKLADTIVTVGGYFVTRKLGLNFLQTAVLTVLVRPQVAHLAVGGYFVCSGFKGAMSVLKTSRDMAALAPQVAFIALGYFTNTQDDQVSGLIEYVSKKLKEEGIRDYLPSPLLVLYDYCKSSNPKHLNIALAVGGYFFAYKYGQRVGLSSLQIAALTILIRPKMAKIAVGAHVIASRFKDAMSALQAPRDMTTFAKQAAFIAVAYFANTPKNPVHSTIQFSYDKVFGELL